MYVYIYMKLTTTCMYVYIYIYTHTHTVIGSDNYVCSEPSHYLNQGWNIVNWSLRNRLQWNANWNPYVVIQGNALENVVCKISGIRSWPQYVKYGPQIVPHIRCWHHQHISSHTTNVGMGKPASYWLLGFGADMCLGSISQSFYELVIQNRKNTSRS